MFMGKSFDVKRLISLITIVGAIIFLYFVLFHIFYPAYKFPRAVRGYLDLSGWNFREKGPYELNGEWEFYPDILLTPHDLYRAVKQYRQVPEGLNSKSLLEKPEWGLGTYHIKITLPESGERYFLKVQDIRMAHCIYINGILVKDAGKVTDSVKDYKAVHTPYMIEIDTGKDLDILIQADNYDNNGRGIMAPLRLGYEEQMELENMVYFGLDMAGLFLFLICGLFYLHLYRMRNNEVVYLYSGIYLILLAFIIITTGEKLLMKVMPSLSFDTAYKFRDFVIGAGFPVLLLFIRSVEPKVMGRKLFYTVVSPTIIYLIMVIITPNSFYSSFRAKTGLYQNIIMVLCVVRLFYILVRKEDRHSPLNEFSYIAASFVFITVMQADAGLVYLGVLHNNAVSKISSFGFLISLNAVLARRYTNKLRMVQLLSEELKQSNERNNEYLNRISLFEVRIKPHFIYNTLNNIIALCYEDIQKAVELVYLLSNYLRNIFRTDRIDCRVSVKKELELIHSFIEIEKLRFGGRLSYTADIDAGVYVEDIRIPPLIIQPLVENAVVHGLFNKRNPGTVKLIITERDSFIKIIVEDDGIGMDEDQLYKIKNEDMCTGIGIRNIRKRLAAIPGASLSIDSELGKGTRCILNLPKEKAFKGVD